MPEPVLRTKLFVPPLRPNLVARSQLIARLNQGLQLGHKLTLISAPAGFGKSTLTSEWLGTNDRPAAWLSLDEADNDPTRFLTYVVAALQTILTEFGEGALAMLHAPQPQEAESILTVLLNEITAVPDNFMLVLDDYHLIEAQAINDILAFTLDHLPPQMHLVIATREDLSIPLARMRARGQMSELRAADLRFTLKEASELLNQMMGLNLAAEDIAALEARTEGWAAGLQMAAISIQGRQDSSRLIKAFTGSHRFVLDYLIEEVLEQRPADVQSFLLQTAVLNRLTGPLCDALTGQENGQATLEMLERANLFIIPLDEERRWYRYHHLFADLLRQRLLQMEPELVPALHSRASAWYEQNGLPADAILQALAAQDYERAANLAEMTWQEMEFSFQTGTWLGWVKSLPYKVVKARPVLSTQYAWALTDSGELEGVEGRLQDAERWLDAAGEKRPEGMVVVIEEQLRLLPGMIAIARANMALYRGDGPNSVKYAELALKIIPEEEYVQRAQATALLGMTHWANGDLEAAHQAMADWVESMLEAGNIYFAVASAFALADIQVALGRLREAVDTYKRSLQMAAEQGEHVQWILAHHHLGLAMLYHEMGEREASGLHLQTSSELGEQSTLIDWPYRWFTAQARLKESAGELEAALDLLEEAQRVFIKNAVPDSRPIGALKTAVFLKQGRLSTAQAWARERGLSAADDLSYLHEFEHLTLARMLIAEYEQTGEEQAILAAGSLLERLLQAAEESGRMGIVLEILIVQALAYQAQDDMAQALDSLKRALVLAKPEGYIRTFVDEGIPMARLLSNAAAQGILPDYVDRLRASFSGAKPENTLPSKTESANDGLVESLSKRELEVLQLIAEGLTNQQIAERLFLSLNTVKVHTRNIYGKLDAHHRAEAVAKANALGILPLP